MTDDNLLTPQQLAERWQTPITWVRQQYLYGQLPYLKFGHRTIRFRHTDVEAFERTHLHAGGAEPVRRQTRRTA